MTSHNASTTRPSRGGRAYHRSGDVRHQVAVTHSTFVGPPASSAQSCQPRGILKNPTGRPSTAAAHASGGLQRSTQNPTVGARDRAVSRNQVSSAGTKSPARADSVQVIVGHISPTDAPRTLRIVNGAVPCRVGVVNHNPVRGTNVRVVVGHVNPTDPPRTLRVVNGDFILSKPAPGIVNQGSSARPRTTGTRPAGRAIGSHPSPVDPRSTRFKEDLP